MRDVGRTEPRLSLLICNEWNWTRRTQRNLNLILDNIIQYDRLGPLWRMDMTEKYGRSFAGKVALVTGGSRGIGEGIVRRLTSDGAAVAFTYFNSEEKAKRLASEIDAAGGKALPIKADSASPEDILATVNQVVRELGGNRYFRQQRRNFDPGNHR